MTHPLLERIPARGITKEEHDSYVEMRGKSYTESWVMPHLGKRHGDGGLVPPKSTQTADSKVRRPVIH